MSDCSDLPDWSEFAPAKINLHLHVVGRRTSGYHELDSLVVFADVGDRLSVLPADSLSLSITGPFAPGLEQEANNLVLRAAHALAAQVGRLATGKLVLEKNLPVASGIGGGSADAAATLRLLCRFWQIDPASSDLDRLAQSLGADVPVCLAGRPALMSGIGEVLVPVPSLPTAGLVLANPGVAVATQAVFRSRAGELSEPAHFPASGWRNVDALVADLRRVRNDLERPARALVPEIDDVLDSLQTAPGCLLARMSGSGATCFGVFHSAQAAQQASQSIARAKWWVWGGRMCGG